MKTLSQKARNIQNSFFARKRRKAKKEIRIQKLLNTFRKNRKLRKRK